MGRSRQRSRRSGQKYKDLARICGYFNNRKHQHRMRYDEHLTAGDPIASGVIEGACGHLVKDRMERSGMRGTLEGARNMLNLRAVFQSGYWDASCEYRVHKLSDTVHPHLNLIAHYTNVLTGGLPVTLALRYLSSSMTAFRQRPPGPGGRQDFA